jgi:hypothetical protein
MNLEKGAGVSAAFVAFVSTARYRLSDVFHLEWDTRTQATLFDVMPLDNREMLPSCDNISKVVGKHRLWRNSDYWTTEAVHIPSSIVK